MKFTVLTLFPELIDAYFAASITAKAVERGLISYSAVNIRDYARDKHKTCDDAPYGGGAGMLLLPEPLGLALEDSGIERGNRSKKVIYLSPGGKPFNQNVAGELARESVLTLICGRYEGIDNRVLEAYGVEELSVGDYVLSSGEVAALALIDAVHRLVEDVITPASLNEESFSNGLLEYPQWTRPEVFAGFNVPEVLLSGHHEKIRRWRLERRVAKTLQNRPDLIEKGLRDGLFDKEILAVLQAAGTALF